ncbi:hypothetical protein NX021_24330 [Cytobacillus firmus]|nr:hypothetical protein [Cytobacillus firmus]
MALISSKKINNIINNGDTNKLKVFMDEINDSETFKEFKALKVLFKFSKSNDLNKVIQSYLSAAKRIPNINLNQERMYIDFIKIIGEHFQQINQMATNIYQNVNEENISEILLEVSQFIEVMKSTIATSHGNQISKINNFSIEEQARIWGNASHKKTLT